LTWTSCNLARQELETILPMSLRAQRLVHDAATADNPPPDPAVARLLGAEHCFTNSLTFFA
jgi:hypothetical protein